MDGDPISDVDVPGNNDFDGRVDADSFAYFGAEESEHRIAESGHGWGGDAPEDELTKCPQNAGNAGFDRPRGASGGLYGRDFRRGF